MRRSERVETVVRVREIQKHLAETETVRRRVDADQRRHDAELARSAAEARNAVGVGGALSFTELARRRTVIEAAAAAVEDTSERVERAHEALELATAAWHDAHRRHDAVDRLLDRTREAELADEEQRTRTELDDIVSTRHGRDAEKERR